MGAADGLGNYDACLGSLDGVLCAVLVEGVGPGGVGTGLDLPFIDVVPQGGGGQLARLTSPFVPTMAGARAQPFIASNPVTGATTWFKPAGKPILWSGDLTACRRVGKIARRARTVSRKR